MLTLSILIDPSELLAGLRQGGASLVLPAPITPRLRERVALRVCLAGQPSGATVLGTVVSVHRQAGSFRVELATDPASLGAVRLLAATARGEIHRFPQRAPRYLVKVPIVVSWNGRDLCMTMVSISQGGCGLRWSGPLPEVGQALRLRLAIGYRSAGIDGVLCWKTAAGASSSAGVRLVGTGGADWARAVAEAARTGAVA